MIPPSKKILYDYLNQDEKYKDHKIDKLSIKMIKDCNNYNVYRWDKLLHPSIRPDHFFYYFKDCKNRERLNPLINNIKLLKKINDNEWVEVFDMYERQFKVKIHSYDYQLLMYVIEEDIEETLGTYQLLNFVIREVDGRYLVRLELIFDVFDMDQEVEVLNQIKSICKLESAILHSLS